MMATSNIAHSENEAQNVARLLYGAVQSMTET
jgi:hypothetical protein